MIYAEICLHICQPGIATPLLPVVTAIKIKKVYFSDIYHPAYYPGFQHSLIYVCKIFNYGIVYT
jgi:hypothetical protein